MSVPSSRRLQSESNPCVRVTDAAWSPELAYVKGLVTTTHRSAALRVRKRLRDSTDRVKRAGTLRRVTDETAEPVDLEGVLADVQAEVERRRRAAPAADGAIGDAVPAEGVAPGRLPAAYEDVESAITRLAAFEYRRNVVDPASSVPGGRAVHRLIDRAVSRQVEDVLHQSQLHAGAVHDAFCVFAEVVVQQLDDLQYELAELRRAINDLRIHGDAT
jgi:hypothetical protein